MEENVDDVEQQILPSDDEEMEDNLELEMMYDSDRGVEYIPNPAEESNYSEDEETFIQRTKKKHTSTPKKHPSKHR